MATPVTWRSLDLICEHPTTGFSCRTLRKRELLPFADHGTLQLTLMRVFYLGTEDRSTGWFKVNLGNYPTISPDSSWAYF